MKKFTAIFTAIAILISMTGILPAATAADNDAIISGYYGIDRKAGLIGQITPGTTADTFLSRILYGSALTLSNGVKTGSVLSGTGAAAGKLTLVVQSDCNGDGQFSITDMLMVKSLLLNQQKFSAAQSQAADVSGDNAVTITDFLQMKKIL